MLAGPARSVCSSCSVTEVQDVPWDVNLLDFHQLHLNQTSHNRIQRFLKGWMGRLIVLDSICLGLLDWGNICYIKLMVFLHYINAFKLCHGKDKVSTLWWIIRWQRLKVTQIEVLWSKTATMAEEKQQISYPGNA